MENLEPLLSVLAAAVLGGAIGIERQVHGHWAGLRTHMTVAMGAALFVLAGQQAGDEHLTRVIQGIAAGVGFLGAGTILKLSDQVEVKGLTTASAIWLSAALGTIAALRMYGLAFGALAMSLVILAALRPLEKWLDKWGSQ